MSLTNLEIRQLMEKKRIKYYELAEVLGVNASTLSRWLQKELTEEQKKQVLAAINNFKY